MRSNSQSKTNKPKPIDDDTPAVLEANLSGPTIVPEQLNKRLEVKAKLSEGAIAMITEKYSTTEQHEALEKLIKEVYGLDLKAFVSDAAEIVGNYSGEDSEMVELLWEASTAE